MLKVFDKKIFIGKNQKKYTIAILIDSENQTAIEAVWDNENEIWNTDFSYSVIGVDSLEVAGELNFDKVKKMGYKF